MSRQQNNFQQSMFLLNTQNINENIMNNKNKQTSIQTQKDNKNMNNNQQYSQSQTELYNQKQTQNKQQVGYFCQPCYKRGKYEIKAMYLNLNQFKTNRYICQTCAVGQTYTILLQFNKNINKMQKQKHTNDLLQCQKITIPNKYMKRITSIYVNHHNLKTTQDKYTQSDYQKIINKLRNQYKNALQSINKYQKMINQYIIKWKKSLQKQFQTVISTFYDQVITQFYSQIQNMQKIQQNINKVNNQMNKCINNDFKYKQYDSQYKYLNRQLQYSYMNIDKYKQILLFCGIRSFNNLQSLFSCCKGFSQAIQILVNLQFKQTSRRFQFITDKLKICSIDTLYDAQMVNLGILDNKIQKSPTFQIQYKNQNTLFYNLTNQNNYNNINNNNNNNRIITYQQFKQNKRKINKQAQKQMNINKQNIKNYHIDNINNRNKDNISQQFTVQQMKELVSIEQMKESIKQMKQIVSVSSNSQIYLYQQQLKQTKNINNFKQNNESQQFFIRFNEKYQQNKQYKSKQNQQNKSNQIQQNRVNQIQQNRLKQIKQNRVKQNQLQKYRIQQKNIDKLRQHLIKNKKTFQSALLNQNKMHHQQSILLKSNYLQNNNTNNEINNTMNTMNNTINNNNSNIIEIQQSDDNNQQQSYQKNDLPQIKHKQKQQNINSYHNNNNSNHNNINNNIFMNNNLANNSLLHNNDNNSVDINKKYFLQKNQYLNNSFNDNIEKLDMDNINSINNINSLNNSINQPKLLPYPSLSEFYNYQKNNNIFKSHLQLTYQNYQQFPPPNIYLPSVQSLTLKYCPLINQEPWEILKSLKCFKKLTQLIIYQPKYTTRNMIIMMAQYFPKLKSLIIKCKNQFDWELAELFKRKMPSLTKFEINNYSQ